jgi:hypothetical protein
VILVSAFSTAAGTSKKRIALVPDSTFGAGTDWGFYFPSPRDDSIGFLEDGSFYMATPRQNKVLLFSKDGKLLSEFGRPGQGPGDLTMPTDVFVLDGRYVGVLEYAQRISLFNLKGEFQKIIKTDGHLVSCRALGQGKIAIVWGSQAASSVIRYQVSILDVESGRQIEITAFRCQIEEHSRFRITQLSPEVYLASTGPDELVVGFSGEPWLTVYSREGEEVRRISLNITARKTKRDELEDSLLANVESNNNKAEQSLIKKVIRENIGLIRLPEYYPYYYKLSADSLGRLFVFSQDAWLDGASVSCQVYSRTGEFITEAIIDEGIYRRVYPSNFFKNSFYALLTKKDDDGSIFLAKIPVQIDSRPQAAPMEKRLGNGERQSQE